MLILAFDSSGPGCSVAVWKDGAALAYTREDMERGQAEVLVPMIAAAMKTAGVGYDALDRIAVTVGPGSFTGVRAGLAAARGVSLASGKPCIGLLTTEVLAAAVSGNQQARRILVAIDTKRGELYVQQFGGNGSPLSGPLALAPEALADWLRPEPVVVVGDGAGAAIAALGSLAVCGDADPMPDARLLAGLAAIRAPAASAPLPVYVYPPAVSRTAPSK